MAERDKLILGARAPAPAMSAKRETLTASRSLRLSVLRTLWRARAPALPVLTGSFHIGSTFWAKPSDQRSGFADKVGFGSDFCIKRETFASREIFLRRNYRR